PPSSRPAGGPGPDRRRSGTGRGAGRRPERDADRRGRGGADADADGVVVDPRFAERRAAVAGERLRRRRNRLLGVVLLLAAVAGAYALTRSPMLDVDRIMVAGGVETSDEEVLAAAGIDPGEQMLDLDLAEARGRVERLPWVEGARLSRSWPGTVRIVVTERTPIAQIADDAGAWYKLDVTGRILDRTTAPAGDLYTVAGVVEGAVPGGHLATGASRPLAVLDSLGPAAAGRVSHVRYVDDDQVELVLLPEGSVRFGEVDEVDEKIVALETVLVRVDDTCLDTIDVRVPDAPVVTRVPTC
ncbi:MAG: FtsQ-type POTRA domain-containing protein, partial [Actinomycetota bacterium]|nr:FtsQ-type POTRA domain-containing protein [Actinomycetota bacterium]